MELRSHKKIKLLEYRPGTSLWLAANIPCRRMTPTQKLSRSQALQPGSLVLETIIQCLEFPELQTCRLVSKCWNSAVVQVMKKEETCRMSLLWSGNSWWIKRKSWGISELKSVLKNSPNFVASEYILHCGSLVSLSAPEIQIFFNLYGSTIKGLGLKDGHVTNDYDMKRAQDACRQILTRQTPNLKQLYLVNFSLTWANKGTLFIPSLKRLGCYNSSGTMLKILPGVPNLQETTSSDYVQPLDLDAFISFNKIHTVKKIICSEDDVPGFVMKLANAKPQIRELEFLVESKVQDLCEPFQKLLQNSKDTLEHLMLSAVCWGTGLQLPKLDKLKILSLSHNPDEQRVFPIEINLQETFPKIHTLNCSGLFCAKNDKRNNYFPPPDAYHGNLPTVKTLKINANCTRLWLRTLHNMCPNFAHLIVWIGHDDNHRMLSNVFAVWPHLESLELRTEEIGSGINLDLLFTGFSKATCLKLQIEAANSNEREPRFEKLRIRPSITSLKDLKKLQINYGCGQPTRRRMSMSRLSAIYAFNLLPALVNVTIDVAYDQYNIEGLKLVIQEMGPYANIRQREVFGTSCITTCSVRL